jgi:peptidyl-prolyl cis-trans isomerase SurA
LEEYGIVSLSSKFSYSKVLSVAVTFLLALPLQAGPMQSKNAKTSSGAPAKNEEFRDIYTDLFPEVVARVNGEPIYGVQLERAIRDELVPIGSPKWADLREDYRGQMVYNSITALVNSKLVFEEAVSNGISVTDDEVQDEYLRASKMFRNVEEMNAYLKSRHIDQDTMIAELHQNLVITKFVDEAIKKGITVTPKEMSDYYSTHPDEFKHPDLVRISRIIIESGATPESDAKARQQAQAILKRIENGEDFAKLAGEYSTGPAASQGGDVGYSDKASLTTEYADVVFSLPVGGVKMIKMQQGYHILKVTDKKKEGIATLEEAKEQLIEFLREQKVQAGIRKLLNGLRDESDIEILIPAGVPLNP